MPTRILVLAPLLWLTACSIYGPTFEKPNLSVAGIEMLDGNFFQQNFLVRLKVQNPNDRELPVNGLSAELKVGGERFATGVSNHAFTVPPFGEAEFDMTVSANVAVGVLKLISKSDRPSDIIDYEINGKVSVDLPFMHSIPFHQSGSFALNSKGRDVPG